MEEKVMKVFAISMGVITILLCAILIGFPEFHTYATHLNQSAKIAKKESVLYLLRDDPKALSSSSQKGMQKQLRLEIPKDVKKDEIKISSNPISHTISITIPGIDENYFYDFPMIGNSNRIEDLTYSSNRDEGTIDIVLDQVYELDQKIDGNYLYLDFIDPHQRYDHIVVIDAGHGKNAAGAIKEGHMEKDIDLAILLKMKKLFDESDIAAENKIGVYYTRTDDRNPSLEERVSLANELKADLFLSIHSNSTASGRMSGIHGTQVMYQVADASGQSKIFATNCLNSLLMSLNSTSKGVVAGDEIYIIRSSKVPVTMAEIGFMTNEEELRQLISEDYQQKAAKALYDAILTSLQIQQ